MAKGMGSIRNRQAQGPFKTSGTEMWPAKMCQWIATLLLSAWASSASTASADVPDTQSKEDKEATLETAEEPADTFPEGERILGGFGPPRVCDLPGGPRDFHDGGGLSSPGRWPPERRSLADSDGWSWLREELEREVFRMAAGGEEGCRLVRDQHFIEELVDTLASWIEAQDLAVPGLIEGHPPSG